MAILKSDASLKQDAALLADRVEGVDSTGEIRFAEATYTMTGSEAATGDSIDICDVPVGAVVIAELCSVANEASMGGSDLALPTLGDAVTANRYSATSVAVHSSTAGRTAFTAVPANVIARHTVTTATRRVRAGFTRTNAPTAGKKLKFVIAFRLA
jgi:hypothetical protein